VVLITNRPFARQGLEIERDYHILIFGCWVYRNEPYIMIF
jgi:hypothetical protein